MSETIYFIDKTTDTFADTLTAYGFAALLERLLRDNRRPAAIRVRDAGSAFAVVPESTIELGFENVEWYCDLPFIVTKSKKAPDGWTGPFVQYEAERDKNTAYFDARKQLPAEARRPGATPDSSPALAAFLAMEAPRPDWQVIAQINQMGAISAYTQALGAWWECRRCFPDLIRLLLAYFSVTPNDETQALTTWKEMVGQYKLAAKDMVTPVQVLNPAMGKGINRTKADGAHRLGNPDSFWPLEFLKFWGMRVAGVPRIIRSTQSGGRGPRDRKTYILHPVNITLSTHQRVYDAFDASMWANTAVKMDVLAAMRYTDVFLEQWLAGQLVDVEWGEEPGNYVSGFTTAFYKDLGNAVALLNLSEIALPRWMKVENADQGQLYREIIEEHRRIVSNLTEKNADEYSLLVSYRNFLSGHDLSAFFEFSGSYSTFLMSKMERKEWAPQFLITHLEVLIMNHDNRLKPILDTPGFQRVATAIRLSTVRPQFFKAKGQSGPYDIRYGLGTELLRQASYPDRFIQSLSEFMHAYNQENAQVEERFKDRPHIRRPNISTDDITDVVALIDSYGSQTVGNLLVAFGYARESKDSDHDDKGPRPDDDSDSDES